MSTQTPSLSPLDHAAAQDMVHGRTALATMRRDEPDGHRGRHDLEYIKRNGERIAIAQAKFLRYDMLTDLLTLGTPGGIRSIRLWAIVSFDGHEVFL